MTTCYRIQERSRDPRELLNPENWTSHVWTGEVYRQCATCHGSGEVWTDADAEYPEECPECGGRGETEDVRRGISVCDSLEHLACYFADRHADLKDVVVVALAGDISEDDDWEAADGALLVYPTAIVRVMTLADAGLDWLREEDAE